MVGIINASQIRPRGKSIGVSRSRRVPAVSVLGAACGIFFYLTFCSQDIIMETSSSLLNNIYISSSNASRKISKTFPPVSCSQVLEMYQSGNATDPNNGKLFVRHTTTNPRFWVSFHNGNYDHVRFSTFEYGYYYEKSLTASFEQVLSAPIPSKRHKHRVIDVGGNIAWFSLLAATQGAEVTTFEPNPHNNLRACESMRLNGWLPCSSSNGGCLKPHQANEDEFHHSNIHIYPYGISEKEGNLFFEHDDFNPGKARVVDYQWNQTTALRVVSLDYMAKELGWLDSDISILKVDVEGEELGVFLGAKELLRSKRVLNLFMEGGGRAPAVQKRFKIVLALLVDSGYKVYKIGGYRGPEYPIDTAPDGTNLVDYYYEQCMVSGKKSKQCNLWWRP